MSKIAALLERIKSTPTYQVEGLKVEIAEQIYLAMQEQNISNAELARRLNTSRAYITKILQGDVNFTLETMGSVAHALGCEFTIELKPQQRKAAPKVAPEYHPNVLPFVAKRNEYRAVPVPKKKKEENQNVPVAAVA